MAGKVGAQVGDWVRFYQGGRFVIGMVQYINTEHWAGPEYLTDIGATTKLFEVRRQCCETDFLKVAKESR